MSTTLSTSRASSRPSKDKHAKAATTHSAQTKSDGQTAKMQQATPEQMRLAQMIGDHRSGDDESEFRKKVLQIEDLTGRNTEDVEIALHDCQNDVEKAVNLLLEGENDQGEWRSSGGKKKKRGNTAQTQKQENVTNHVDEKQDKREQSNDRDRHDRPERSDNNRDRRGRRFDSRPPRLAKGRGRERGGDFFRGNKDNNEHDTKENGFGTFDKDRDIDGNRGRGRGRGRGGSRRGRGRSFNRNPRFEKGPQIDTWTNETAENAEKENTADGWQSMEDWNETDDSWTGSLNETKIFTKSTSQSGEQHAENSAPMTDSTNTIIQRLPVDLGLLTKSNSDPPESSYITQYNQQATESIKNSIGIGSSPRQGLSSQMGGSSLTNHLQTGSSLSSQLPSTTLSNQLTNSQMSNSPSSSAAVNALVSSFAQQTSYSQNQSSYSQSSSGFSQSQSSGYSTSPSGYNQNRTEYSQGQSGFNQGQPSVYSQSSGSVYGQSQNSVYAQTPSSVYNQSAASAFTASQSLNSSLDQPNSSQSLSQSTVGDSVPVTQQQANVLPQRPKTQRTKLPPPSKIPASAVEMPGHMMTTLDVQFGNWPESSFSFMGDSPAANNLTSTGTSSTTSTISSHLSQVSQPSESVMSSSIMTTPPSNNTPVLSDQGQTSPRTNMFHNSPYTTPTKKDPGPRTQNKMSPPEPIPFPPSQTERKSSPLMSTQRPSSNSSLSSATTKPDASNLNSYTQSSPGYQSSAYQSQKAALSSNALSNNPSLTSATGLPSNQGLSNTGLPNNGLSNSSGISNTTGLSNTSGLSNSGGLSNTAGLSNATGLSNAGTISNTTGLSNSSGLSNTSGYSHSSNQPGSYQSQYQTGSNQYQASQNQYGQSTQNQYGQSGQSQYQNSGSQYHNSQTQFQNYSQTAGSSFQNQNSYTGSGNYSGSSNQQNQGTSSLYQNSATNSYQTHSNQNSLYHQGASSQTTSYQPQSNSTSSYHRDSQAGSYPTSVSRDSQSASFQANVSQAGSYPTSASRDSQSGASAYPTSVGQSSATSYQRDSQQSALSSTNVTQSPSAYTSQGYGSSQHQNSLPSNLQTSPLSGVNANKISETLSKMTVKDSAMDTRQSPSQYDSSTSTTTSSLTTTTITTSLSTGSTTPSSVTTPSMSAVTTTVSSSARISSAPSTTKATPSLPPGVQLLAHQYIMGQAGTLPPFYGLQQPLYASYTDELQLLQQRLPPLPNYNYDMAFGVPTTITGREQTTLGSVPYSGAENKLGRVDAQSPIPSTQQQQQQQTTQSAHQQHFINVPYGYYYPSVLPNAAAAAGFQYPATMFPVSVPPVTNTAHAGTTANTQYQKTFGSHGYGSKQGYEDLTQGTDFTKSTYVNQSQNKVSAGTGSVTSVAGAGDIPGTGYGKSHTQAFDKQGFHAGTPPPFNLPLGTGTQAGPLGATTPYAAAPFVNVPMMPQPHSQMLHPTLQQDSTSGSSRGSHVHTQQTSTQAKTGGAKYANNWGTY